MIQYLEHEAVLEKLEDGYKYESNAFITANCGNTVTFSRRWIAGCLSELRGQAGSFDNVLLVNALQRRVARIEESLGHE